MIKGQPVTTMPGVYKLPNGQFWIRAMVWDATRGKPKDTSKTLPLLHLKTGLPWTKDQLAAELIDLRAGLRDTGPAPAARKRFSEYADEVFASKWSLGIIRSPATKQNYEMQRRHLDPVWGDVFLDMITRDRVIKWMEKLGDLVLAGEYKASSVNDQFKIFKAIMAEACVAYSLPNPTFKVRPIKSAHKTYTRREPNSLTVEELPVFFAAALEYEPEHFAMIMLGQLTGRRPCELRAIRALGADADIEWDTGILDIRRSQTLGAPVEQTKQGKDVTLYLPPSLLGILRKHRDEIKGARQASPLLFPPRGSRKGPIEEAYMTNTVLKKPLKNICQKAGIKKRITASGAMRRTYQDLCRAAEVRDVVQMAMSGHATIEMKALYSTVAAVEGKASLTRMARIAGIIAE